MLTLLLGLACSTSPADTQPTEETPSEDPALADVIAVTTSGEPGAYTFSVTLQSPDTGCELYADWWEVVSPEGELVFRRILNHSHPDEQPFTRSGSPVAVASDQEVVVRAHLAPGGYGGQAMRGIASGGFAADEVEEGWGASLETQAPLPEECWF